MIKGLKAILTLINEENEHNHSYQRLLNDMYDDLKALEIIKEKGIILQFIKETYTVEQYNTVVFGTLVKPLTEKEYDLIKGVLYDNN